MLNLLESSTVEGPMKAVTDNVNLAQFAMALPERYLDANLQRHSLKLSIVLPMLLGTRFRFVTEAGPTFCPFNRVSNLVLRTARGAMPKEGSPESGGDSRLEHFLCRKGYGITTLN